MKDLEKMYLWLQTYPQWESVLSVDFVEEAPGNAGLFPGGLEERSRQADVLGNLQIDCRYRFELHLHTLPQPDGAAYESWLLDFQNWVQQQSAAGLAPHFGDIPAAEHLQAQKGKLKQRGQTAIYTVTLLADFTRVYEA